MSAIRFNSIFSYEFTGETFFSELADDALEFRRILLTIDFWDHLGFC